MSPRTLVNIARAPIVEEDALYPALKDGRLGGAAIDVWWQYRTPAEPDQRPSRQPFHELPNVLMTPHCSGFTDGTAERRWSSVASNLAVTKRRASDLTKQRPKSYISKDYSTDINTRDHAYLDQGYRCI